ncbi:MAG: Hsp20/alpha crystallin family protein [Alphaproteobacteria bacterium]|nr:Hsp20/alpha crystallin family protein [Alphaproteobacteria bacterium]
MTNNQLTSKPDRNRDPFNWLRREVDQLFDNMWPTSRNVSQGFSTQKLFSALPHIDVSENEKEFIVTADLPGLEEKDVSVEFNNKILTIRGEKKSALEDKQENYYLSERWSGSFYRSLQLPVPINENQVNAIMKNGVLYVSLPKMGNVPGEVKKIEVKKG